MERSQEAGWGWGGGGGEVHKSGMEKAAGIICLSSVLCRNSPRSQPAGIIKRRRNARLGEAPGRSPCAKAIAGRQAAAAHNSGVARRGSR